MLDFSTPASKKTIDEDLPYETEFLRRYDRFRASVETLFDMPERTMDLLFRFLTRTKASCPREPGARSLQP